MITTKNKWSWLVIMLVSLIIYPTTVKAESHHTLSQALRAGLQHNQDLHQARNQLTNIYRDRAKIEAELGWQVELSSNYRHSFNQNTTNQLTPNNISLNTSKTWENGLSIRPGFALDLSDISPSITINLAVPIFPRTPTQPVRMLYQNQAELIKTEANIQVQTAQKITEWISNYLELARAEQQLAIANQRLDLTIQEYNLTLAKAEISEASNDEIVGAQLQVLDRELQQQRQLTTIEANKRAFSHELGLRETATIIFNHQANLLSQMELLVSDLPNYDKGLEIILNNHPDILTQHINQELLELELEWLQADSGLDVSTSLVYDSAKSDTTISITGSYNLWDGGKHQIDLDEKIADITNVETQLENLKFRLEQDLLANYNNLRFLELELEQAKMRLDSSINSLKIAEKQYEAGIIDEIAYKESYLKHQESSINHAASHDQLLIAKLQLLIMFNPQLIIEEVTQ